MNTSLPVDSVQGLKLVDQLVTGVLDSVELEMRGQPASMVLEILKETLARRLPGIYVDDELLRTAAARIAVGLTPV
jgi:hypothetical protein